MSKTPATRALDRARIAYTVHEYPHDEKTAEAAGGYGQEAAHALGVDPATVFKTLLVDVDGALVVAICPVDARLDLKAVARAAGGKKAALADPGVAQRATGYVVGGISPLGQKKRLTTLLDASAQQHPTILVSGGRRGLDLELAPGDLLTLTGGTFAALADR